jgi:uncharacterized RDD family membrane protein YckC
MDQQPSSENPYQPPLAECHAVEPETIDMTPVSRWARLVNLLLDEIIMLPTAFGVGVVAYFIGLGDKINRVPDIVFGIVFALLYYIPQEALFGKTIGKMVTGTRVISNDGHAPTFGQIVTRTFCRMIPFEPFSFFGGGEPMGWHDTISETRVVRDRQV